MARNRAALERWWLPALLAAVVMLALVVNSATSRDVYATLSGRLVAAPHRVRVAVEVVSEGGLVLLAVLFAVIAAARWRRSGSLLPMTTGLSVVAAYAASECLKTLHAAPRPCWSSSAARIVAECPAAGDWSLPSNHSAIAAALGAAVLLLAPRLWPPVVGLVVAVGAARVGLGVHYPHDVLDGFTVGAGVVLAVHAGVLLAMRRLGRRRQVATTEAGA
ncbi:MAG TPA: phosphatase PAP2 family protein [Mycobacteriales bacterium]|nr:phosphatase PAP2 family protein [Mycobacteriales bacterium]